MTPQREKALSDLIAQLDGQIEHADDHGRRLRAQRRDARRALHDAGWSWRRLGRLSGHSHFAVKKDTEHA